MEERPSETKSLNALISNEKSSGNGGFFIREYLISHPDVAAEYERLKQNLAERYQFDRDAYTEAKTPFVRKYTRLAKA